MATRTRTKYYRDPVHGFIDVRPQEQAIIKSEVFQRLRRIHQLSFCYLVYHGAEHSRFGHSLGVMHLTSAMYQNAIRNAEELGTDTVVYDDHDEEKLRLAALLHDIGHCPFSHGLERNFDSHEKYSKALTEGPLSSLIESAGHDPKEISGLIEGHSKKPYLAKILHSQLDADRMDYLTRDSHYTGVLYGVFDLDRLLKSIAIKKGELVVLDKGLHAADQFLISRFYMYEQVYLHKVKRAFEGMATLFAQNLEGGLAYPTPDELSGPEGLATFLECDDEWFLRLAKDEAKKESALGKVAKQLIGRNPYKTVTDSEEIRSIYVKKDGSAPAGAGLSGAEILAKVITDGLGKLGLVKLEVLFDTYRNLPLQLRPYSNPLPHESSGEEISPIYIYDPGTDTLDIIENKSTAIRALSENIPRIARIYASRDVYDSVNKLATEHKEALRKGMSE